MKIFWDWLAEIVTDLLILLYMVFLILWPWFLIAFIVYVLYQGLVLGN